MSKPIQTVEELDAVLHWRGKHALAIKERDALQQRLTAADELNDTTKAELAWQESDNAELRKRADVLERALSKIKLRCDAYLEAEMGMSYDSVEACQTIADAALKPAEVPQ
ncbi:hypothetical protein HYE76_10410 [Pseudomonas tolaasii]|uniref:hypothetical protein n=1 Tax=Pseudomonas tolaasii TaxID=29442 RepID=UPI00159FC9DA|nr:hypothetical protein [Pseudomonas tolaasii]NWC26878.1 hypothetical protein [Pseudomonas tolaasii]